MRLYDLLLYCSARLAGIWARRGKADHEAAEQQDRRVPRH
jgi:hypothetical protein